MKMKDHKGFTLIEILVALAIFSIILVALYSTFLLSHRAMAGSDEILVRLQESRMALDIIKREIESSLYTRQNRETLFRVKDRDIHGRQTSGLIFTTFSPVRPAISEVSYFIKVRDDRLILMKEVNSPHTSDAAPVAVEIIEDVESFTVEVKHNGRWIKTWDSAMTYSIPDRVRIAITVRLNDRTLPLVGIAEPMIGRTI